MAGGHGHREEKKAEPAPLAYSTTTTFDVAHCALLAEGVAVMVWHLPTVIKTVGKGGMAFEHFLVSSAAKLKVSEEFVAGIEVIAIALGYHVAPRYYMGLTIHEFYERLVLPAWNSCRKVGYEFTDLPQNLSILVSTPDFYNQRSYDSAGISQGKSCASANSGLFGGGLLGCLDCCTDNFGPKSRFRVSCSAVCNARFK